MTQFINKHTITSFIDQAKPEALLEYIEQAFVHYSSGKAVVPPVGTLHFEQPPADVHIKYGYIKGEEHYVIKIASGFYDNPQMGLSSSNGLNLVFSQKNGLLEVVLLDEGYLTDVRTAVAGAVTAKYLAPKEVRKIGIIGTGIQARLQLEYLQSVCDCKEVMVWGRNKTNAAKYVEEMTVKGFNVEVVEDTDSIAASCDLIVTATPAKEPLISANKLKSDVLITAMGADTIGKQELDMDILKQATLITLDSTSQCQDHGEIHKAFQSEKLLDVELLEIGDIVTQKDFVRPEGIIVADLTGIATQDMMISKYVLDNL